MIIVLSWVCVEFSSRITIIICIFFLCSLWFFGFYSFACVCFLSCHAAVVSQLNHLSSSIPGRPRSLTFSTATQLCLCAVFVHACKCHLGSPFQMIYSLFGSATLPHSPSYHSFLADDAASRSRDRHCLSISLLSVSLCAFVFLSASSLSPLSLFFGSVYRCFCFSMDVCIPLCRYD